jgi:hypothetical protein
VIRWLDHAVMKSKLALPDRRSPDEAAVRPRPMIAIVGLIFIIVSVAVFWRLLPTDGTLHRLATAPFLESIIRFASLRG